MSIVHLPHVWEHRAVLEHVTTKIGSHIFSGGKFPGSEGQQRNEPQHIAHPLHGGELPVGSVATSANRPDDEGM